MDIENQLNGENQDEIEKLITKKKISRRHQNSEISEKHIEKNEANIIDNQQDLYFQTDPLF